MKIFEVFNLLSLVSILSIILTQIFSKNKNQSKLNKFVYFFSLPFFVLFLYLVYRNNGIDINSYKALYESPFDSSWDYGFSCIMWIAKNFLTFKFSSFILLSSIASLFFIYKVTKNLALNFSVVAVIYISHFGVIRDLAQLRIGLAIALLLYAYFCQKGLLRMILTLLAISIHLTSIFLYLIFSYNSFLQKFSIKKDFKLIIYVAFFILTLLTLKSSFSILNLFDERINIYNIFVPFDFDIFIRSFIFQFLLVLLAFYNFSLRNDRINKLYFYTLVSALLTNLFFINYPIFSSRLSSIAMSLYPFMISSLIINLGNESIGLTAGYRYTKFLIRILICLFLIALLFRPGNLEVISSIDPVLSFNEN